MSYSDYINNIDLKNWNIRINIYLKKTKKELLIQELLFLNLISFILQSL
jgi:hypothetical protein